MKEETLKMKPNNYKRAYENIMSDYIPINQKN